MNLVLDTGILGKLCHPTQKKNRPVVDWLSSTLDDECEYRVFLPEICDYELRRKLLHLVAKGQVEPRSIDRLNDLTKELEYLPIDTATMRHAAELWANARSKGVSTADEKSLDGDVILAAQSALLNATMVTDNVKHLARYGTARHWTELQPRPEGPIPYVEGIAPPRGYMQARLEGSGERVWIRPESVVISGIKLSQLSQEQIERTQQIWQQLREVWPISFDDCIAGFQQDKNSELEISLWERIADVYVRELHDRPKAGLSERQLLFKVIVGCSMTSSLDEVLSTNPETKRLPNLARVDARWRGISAD